MAIVLGINAAFHDPAAALVVDGETVAAAEEERFSRRKHGKRPVPFSAWEQPEQSARWCLQQAGVDAADVDAIAYSYDPSLVPAEGGAPWEELRTTYAERAGHFLRTAVPGLDPERLEHVPHHLAHAASAYLAAPFGGECAVMTVDGRGEAQSYLAGHVRDGKLDPLAEQVLPHSLGLLYEELTVHLGFHRSSDEYKIMAMASYGEPRWLDVLREEVHVTPSGGFAAMPTLDLDRFVPARGAGAPITQAHKDLAASVQARLEEVLIELATWLHRETGERRLAMAGGVALNCVANSRLWREGPFDEVWVQPAAGDAGTALGAALEAAHRRGDRIRPMTTPALGRGWDDDEIEAVLVDAALPYARVDDVAGVVADALADDQVVAWFQGRAEFGPRALGHRSLLANPTNPDNTQRLNVVKGRESFRPVAPMVHLDHAEEIFDQGPVPSPYMLFTHRARDAWRDRIPAAVHVDGTARAQTVDPADEPLVADMLAKFADRSGVPVVINTSLNTAGRPIVDHPREALECFGSAAIDLLAIGPFVVRRATVWGRA